MKLRFLFSVMLGASLAAGAQGYQDGVDNYNADRFDIAKNILTKTLNDPGTDKAVSLYYLGNIAFQDKDYAGAKKYFQQGYEVNPNYAYNIIGLGQMALQEGDKATAQKYFDQALKTDKKNTDLMAAVARAYWNVAPKSTKPYDDSDFRTWLGNSYVYSKDIKKLVDKAFKESGNKAPAIYMLMGDMAARLNPGVAAGNYEMAINNDRELNNVVNREAYVKYAHVYDVHNRPLVIEKLEELNELEPNSGLAQRELAEQYYMNQQFDKAWKSYEKYVQNPNHVRVDEQRYSALLYGAKQYEESIKWAEKVLKQDPSVVNMYQIIMLDYNALENDSMAVVNGDKLFASDKYEPTVNDFIVYGNALMKVGRADDAVKVFDKGIAAYPDNDRAKTMIPLLSKAYAAAGNSEKAIEVQMAYLDSGAASASDYYTMYNNYIKKAGEAPAGSAQAKSDYESALKYINMAIEKEPNFYFYYYQKGVCNYMMNGNKANKEAAEAMQTMLDKLSANSPEYQKSAAAYVKSAYAVMGNYYQDVDPEKAAYCAQKVEEMNNAQ
ncbi:MAG: tetratricopeptide repeat protein [Bacteroides sp.]|nr:tetratricopeptide repeat protein [Bacteroides sp.]MCM1412789.1 tetratricopeptide repeat protein [Bacteroides sp.]MCM1470917.1 tetratricopeptide repeat protein [Bacteroides sp.]